MTKGGCENKSALLSLLILNQKKLKKKKSNLSLENENQLTFSKTTM